MLSLKEESENETRNDKNVNESQIEKEIKINNEENVFTNVKE